jgi:hypothetical protein
MRFSIILSAGIITLAAAAPIKTRADSNYFQVTKFSYGCTTTCDWSFDVTVVGQSSNHPAVSTPVTWSGSLADKDYMTCRNISNTQTISAYIKKSNNDLLLHYQVGKPKQGARYNYYGHTHVNAATSGIAQPKKFQVKESRATGVA